jgi:hypothetical protein
VEQLLQLYGSQHLKLLDSTWSYLTALEAARQHLKLLDSTWICKTALYANKQYWKL